MSNTPKWYCRNKIQSTDNFIEIIELGHELRRVMKRVIMDVRLDVYDEHNSLVEDCERVIDKYWSFKDKENNEVYQSLMKKIKRSPYNVLLMKKFEILTELNDRRFCQLTYALKMTLISLLRKSSESEIWLNWALQITQLYNKSYRPKKNPEEDESTDDGEEIDKDSKSNFNANICSNMYPELLLPFKPVEFSSVLQLVSQARVEQNALDLMFGLFDMGEDEVFRGNAESNCSSLEILRILTLNLTGDGEMPQSHDASSTAVTTPISQRNYSTAIKAYDEEVKAIKGAQDEGDSVTPYRSMRYKHTEQFLQKERAFIAEFITKAFEVAPSIFGSKDPDLDNFAARGMRQIWSYVGLILDHILLWWIDTPISCYSIAHVDSIRKWLLSQTENDIPEPVLSTLRGIGEILTNFVCNNTWDQLFRYTLISASCPPSVIEKAVEQFKGMELNQFGTPTGTIWTLVFSSLINLSNSYFPQADMYNARQLPIAEQIPILHRIDHSVHCMRLWVKEQAKWLCSEWKMDPFFQITEHDVKITIDVFNTLKLPQLTADASDILTLVNVALRAKLVCEVNVNLGKLKKTPEECVQTLSSVCGVLSLANFALCFPGPHHWQQTVYDDEERSAYVGYVLDQIFLPTIKATHDIVILKLILKIICESWLDYIYKKRIKFSVNGAVRLLNDFDEVREWILSCTLLDEEQLNLLSNHEVLRMCKGVGKILLRKPEDVISITHSPKYDKKSSDSAATAQETQLPSEMFVSNQKHWLQLRARNSKFPFWKLCCGDEVL